MVLVDFERLGDGLFHFGDVGDEFGGFGDDGGIDVDDFSFFSGDHFANFFQEDSAADVFPLRIGGREVMTDVAATDGAQKRVGDGMEEGVAVGMAGQAHGMGNFDAAKVKFVAFGELVDVVADADALHRG